MKNILFLFLITFNFGAMAQTIIPIETYFDYNHMDNVYFKDVNNIFTKFLGTWEYADGTHYFKITFYKQEQTQFGKTSDGRVIVTKTQFSDRIYSHYIYKHNGVTVYNDYPSDGINPAPYMSDIDGERGLIENNNKLFLSYREPSTTDCLRTKWGILYIEHQQITQTQTQLIWTRTDRNIGSPPYGCPNGTMPDTSEFKIPANMVLTKI